MILSNQYKQLGEKFSQASMPTQVDSPQLLLWNDVLAKQLNIQFSANEAAQYFSGNLLITGSEPVAMAYSGHQFGQFNPHLGDGRAHLLGELVDSNNVIYELQLKGSGRTPYSRNGDGKCGIKPAVREFIMSEAMHALGVPTTRCLSVVTTGEDIYRQTSTPGAVVTRVASSHLRVGTFEYFAARNMRDELTVLADLAISRHFPKITETDDSKYIKLITYAIDKQIELVTSWMRVGFIHGVMNTDNTLLSGDTIDYGPCAMMGVYDPHTVFSSIDHQGRYAFGNQAWIAQWNMARFAESLLPLIADGGEQAIKLITPLIEEFGDKYQQSFSLMMAQKLGFESNTSEVVALSNELLEIMFKKQLDYTQTFIDLQSALTHKEPIQEPLLNWFKQWNVTLLAENHSIEAAAAIMQSNNPLVIPRNHHIEAVLSQVEETPETIAVDEFMAKLKNPYQHTENIEKYQDINPDSDLNYQTFCGT